MYGPFPSLHVPIEHLYIFLSRPAAYKFVNNHRNFKSADPVYLGHGSQHDNTCFVCGGLQDLLHCQTCQRSYHEQCLKQPISRFFHEQTFFCEVCIERKWHYEAPQLSPPASPRPERARVPLPADKPGCGTSDYHRIHRTAIFECNIAVSRGYEPNASILFRAAAAQSTTTAAHQPAICFVDDSQRGQP